MAAGLYGMIRYSGLAFGSAIAGTLLENRLAHRGTSLAGSTASWLAFHDVFWFLVLIGLVGIVCSWLIGSHESRQDLEAETSSSPSPSAE